MFSIVLVTMYCVANVIATVLYLRKNYMSIIFDGIAISTFIAAVLFFISGQVKGMPIAQFLYSSKMHLFIITMILFEIVATVSMRKKK